MSKKEKEVNQPNIRSADDLIVRAEAEKLGKIMPEIQAKEESPAETESPKIEAALESKPEPDESSENTEEQTEARELEPEAALDDESGEDNTSEDASLDDDAVDDYGTKVGKAKMYSQDEVNKMIRDRLKRGQHAEAEVTQAAKDFTPDPNSEESWEVQLEGFVEKTLEKISKKNSEAQWREQETQTQAEFEVKFSEGMSKYKDFEKVVGGKPITNAMMLAARSMSDPAAFLYAACKQHPKELARISEIKDSVHQATEIGRLEERMKKARKLTTATKPASKISGDASSEMPQVSIDARIAAHAKTKFAR